MEAENKDSRSLIKEDEHFLDVLGNQQLTKKIIKQGNEGSRPERSFIVKINLKAKLENGKVIDDKENLVIQVGDVEVCQGVDMCIPLMNVGEIAEINVDSRFAYGELGWKGTDGNFLVPPNTKLLYTIELISAKEESELETKSFTARKEIGNKKRERGNWWFERGDYSLSIQLYRRALEYLDETEGGIVFDPEPSTDELQDLLEDRIKVYNNLAQAQMKISAYDTALKSIDTVLLCRPDNIKALFRKGKILEAKGNTSEAIKFLQKAATLDYNNKTIQNELSKLILKSKREARNEKNMYQKMLGSVQKFESKNKKVVTTSKEANSKFKLCGYLLGSILIGITGMALYRWRL